MYMSKIGNIVIDLLDQGHTIDEITNSQVELVR